MNDISNFNKLSFDTQMFWKIENNSSTLKHAKFFKCKIWNQKHNMWVIGYGKMEMETSCNLISIINCFNMKFTQYNICKFYFLSKLNLQNMNFQTEIEMCQKNVSDPVRKKTALKRWRLNFKQERLQQSHSLSSSSIVSPPGWLFAFW